MIHKFYCSNSSCKNHIERIPLTVPNSRLDEMPEGGEFCPLCNSAMVCDSLDQFLSAGPFTRKEKIIMDKLIGAHSLFVQLDRQHPSEAREWESAMHQLQQLLGLRILRREHPDVYPIKK